MSILAIIFFGFDTKRKGNKSKNKQVRLHQIKMLLRTKGNQQNKRVTYKMGEISANHMSDKGYYLMYIKNQTIAQI